ncbi:MAG: sugar transferase [Candidatus Omnitrophica bacterium]|nr:sugar transferase [Candidatus Omnitrophota bacterium]
MYRSFGKRLFDIIFSLVGILVLIPLFCVVGIWIKLDSPGPVFFIQKRMGRGGRLFPLMKFRTMFTDSSKERLLFEPGRKNRITKAGGFLRWTKIDELPQLFNVLVGQMSFVGPRPEVPKYEAFYRGANAEVLSVRPGVTDLASIKYRHEEELLAQNNDPEKFYTEVILPDKLKINLEYVRGKISLMTDISAIGATVVRLKSKQGKD